MLQGAHRLTRPIDGGHPFQNFVHLLGSSRFARLSSRGCSRMASSSAGRARSRSNRRSSSQSSASSAPSDEAPPLGDFWGPLAGDSQPHEWVADAPDAQALGEDSIQVCGRAWTLVETVRCHQKEALEKYAPHVGLADPRLDAKGQLIMACGSGKTYMGIWMAEMAHFGRGAKCFVLLFPNLLLVGQTLREWRRKSRLRCSRSPPGQSVNSCARSLPPKPPPVCPSRTVSLPPRLRLASQTQATATGPQPQGHSHRATATTQPQPQATATATGHSQRSQPQTKGHSHGATGPQPQGHRHQPGHGPQPQATPTAHSHRPHLETTVRSSAVAEQKVAATVHFQRGGLH